MNQTKRNMNLRLDRVLPEDEREQLDQHLVSAPGDAIFWDRLQAVDGMLRNAPRLEAPPDLCDRIMLSIAARPATRTANRLNLGPVLGLVLAVVVGAPLAVGGIALLQQWLADPMAIDIFLNTVWQPIVNGLTTVVEIGATAFALLIPIMLVGAGFFWLTSPRRQSITYRIPVTAA